MAVTDWAVIENGVVVNVIVVEDQDFIPAYKEENPTYTLVQIDTLDPTPGMGWSYSRGKFKKPKS